MKLYVWRSKALMDMDYREGYLIALANSTDEARSRIRVERRKEDHWVDEEELESDLAKEPMVQETGAILITGSA